MRPVNGKIDGMEAIENDLAIIDKIEKFPRREITFPVDVILEKWGVVSMIKLEVKYAVNIPRTFTVFGNDGFARFLALARQKIGGHMTQEIDVEDGMNFHRFWEHQFDDEKVSFKHTFDWERSNMTVV